MTRLYWGEAALAALPYKDRSEIYNELFHEDQEVALSHLPLDEVCWKLADMTGDDPSAIRMKALGYVAEDIRTYFQSPAAGDYQWAGFAFSKWPRLAAWWIANRSPGTVMPAENCVYRWFTGLGADGLGDKPDDRLVRLLRLVQEYQPKHWQQRFFHIFTQDIERAKASRYPFNPVLDADREIMETIATNMASVMLRFPVMQLEERTLSTVNSLKREPSQGGK